MKHRRMALLSLWLVMGLWVLAPWPAGARAQVGGWQWQNPLPQGNWLYGAWGTGGSDVFAVGEDGTILHYAGPPRLIYLPLVLKNHAP